MNRICLLVSLFATVAFADVDYIAHQGEERLAPSHSKPAYRFAAEHGLDYLKLDVQLTKDDEVVLQHDATLKATMNWDRRIRGLTLAEIREKGRHRAIKSGYRDAYTNETIVTLHEALEIAKTGIRKGLWIDFKYFTPKFAEKVFGILGEHGYTDDKVMVATFQKNALKWVQENRPKVRRVAHTAISLKEGGFTANVENDKALIPDEAALVEALDAHGKKYGLHGFNLPAPMGRNRPGWNTTPFVIQELKKRGYWISIWFVNNSACGEKYRELADAFVTNCKADTFPAASK